jgi:hypothetical protein
MCFFVGQMNEPFIHKAGRARVGGESQAERQGSWSNALL